MAWRKEGVRIIFPTGTGVCRAGRGRETHAESPPPQGPWKPEVGPDGEDVSRAMLSSGRSCCQQISGVQGVWGT